MLFWHIGATTGVARYTFRDERMDVRFLAIGALLPDIIDTIPGLVGYETFGSVRLWGHSLAFSGLLMVVILFATRRGRPRKRWMPVAIGALIHLFLDAMWADPETLWWPLLGNEFSPAGPVDVGAYIQSVLRDVRMWLGEAAGLVYLAVLGWRAGMRSAEARRSFYASGRLNVPIGTTDR